jgi:hypothetical protein
MSVMQLGFGDFCEVLGGEIEHSRAKSQNGAPGEASKINKPSNGLGKSGLIGLQGFSRHSPKRGQYATSKSPRALGKVTFEAFRVRLGTELGTPGPGVFVPEVATRVCRRAPF